jgi:GTP-binding protein
MEVKSSRFLKSAAKREHSPELRCPEVAIIGRSNVGKSTLINFLTNRKELAKASKVPGKTQLINFFLINESWMLVDFPGYGYAKKGKDTREERLEVMEDYLTNKSTIKEVLLLINGHLPPQKVDKIMIEALIESKIAFSVVITKTDKAPLKAISKNIKELKQHIQSFSVPMPEFILTSSAKRQGNKLVLNHIEKKLA